ERVDGLVFAPNDEDRIRIDFEREIVAGPWNFAPMSGKQPARAPDAVHFPTIHFAVRVEVAFERPTRATLGDERFDGALHDLRFVFLIVRPDASQCFSPMARVSLVSLADVADLADNQ